jgi:uroporphyrin-3 C-methyltransferase
VTWWQNAWQVFLSEARGLVRVSRIETPDAALLTPEQSFFLRENLKLKLLNARLGLLARQIDSSKSDLTDAEAVLSTYFEVGSRKTQGTLQLLRQVKDQMRTLQVPRIDETLAALATAAVGR